MKLDAREALKRLSEELKEDEIYLLYPGAELHKTLCSYSNERHYLREAIKIDKNVLLHVSQMERFLNSEELASLFICYDRNVLSSNVYEAMCELLLDSYCGEDSHVSSVLFEESFDRRIAGPKLELMLRDLIDYDFNWADEDIVMYWSNKSVFLLSSYRKLEEFKCGDWELCDMASALYFNHFLSMRE